MNEKEQNFDPLKRLLKLKRHEVPPPGYFNTFSRQVTSRIRAGEVGGSQSLADRLRAGTPWFSNLLQIFEFRPGLIGGFAASLCLLLVVGVLFAEHSEQSSQDLLVISPPLAQPQNSLAALATTPVLASASQSGGIMASTNPMTSLQPVATLFGQSGGSALFQPASFAPVSQ